MTPPSFIIQYSFFMTQETRQLFGTDGIRGIAGEFPLTQQSTYLIGRALGHDLMRVTRGAQAVIGQDTRESSRWIADRVAAGLSAVGVHVHSAGIITTPGIAFLARSRGFAAGVVTKTMLSVLKRLQFMWLMSNSTSQFGIAVVAMPAMAMAGKLIEVVIP